MRVTYVLDTLTEETSSNRKHNIVIFSFVLLLCLSYRSFVRLSVEKVVYPENVQFCASSPSSSSFFFFFFFFLFFFSFYKRPFEAFVCFDQK